jgi:predicted HD phosphohydrolase
MSSQEVAEFRNDPFYGEAVRVRLWDEAGKVPGMHTPPFDYYALLLQRVIDRHMAGKRVRASH